VADRLIIGASLSIALEEYLAPLIASVSRWNLRQANVTLSGGQLLYPRGIVNNQWT